MANSNNVVRCGLSPKHKDITELNKLVKFEPALESRIIPEIIDGNQELLSAAIDEFALAKFKADEKNCIIHKQDYPEIVLAFDTDLLLKVRSI